MAEIPDDQLEALVKAATLLQNLSSNPQALSHLERSIKAINPNVETTEEAAARQARPLIEPIQSEVAELRAQLSERIKADDDRRAAAEMALQDKEINSAFQRLQDNDGYTPEGIENIKKLMVDRKIADPEAAAALFSRMHPPAKQEQSSWEPARWNLEDNAVANNVSGLFTDPDKWADNEVGQVLLEERRKVSQE